MKNFDSKNFNSEVFTLYSSRIPDVKKNELIKAGVFVPTDYKNVLSEQVGGNHIVRPFKGLIGKSMVNYDGKTDIKSNSSTTYSQSIVVVGRADAWVEKDFSYDITGGVDFMDNVAQQVAKYWEDNNQGTLITILKAIFGIEAFAKTHLVDVKGEIQATSINTACQRACGDNKDAFKVAIMHSVVSTQLENLNLLERLKYTDPDGIQRDLTLGTVNGKLVFIDDSVPFEIVEKYELTEDVDIDVNKDYFTKSGNTYTKVSAPKVANIATYYELVDSYTEYTTYILGVHAFEYEDVGVKVAYEMTRDALKNGGEDTLISRKRQIFVPHGFSFDVTKIQTESPTDEELGDSKNWSIIQDASKTKSYPLKAIPICALITRA